MKRLTERKFGGIVSKREEETGILCSSFCNDCSQGAGNCKYVKAMVEKLAEYETLEEKGLLLKLPCKVGDRLWIIISDSLDIESQIILSIIIGKNNDTITFKNHSFFTIWNKDYHEYFGKTVFLTQSEAEEALKRLEVTE